MNLPLPNASATGGVISTAIEEKSALPVLSRRFGASLIDAIILGTISAAMVFAQLSVLAPDGVAVDFATKAAGAGLAFALAFLDVMTFTGLLGFIAIIFAFDSYMYDVYLPAFLPMVLVLNALYHVTFEQSKSGATPGKRLLGLRVGSSDGSPPHTLRAFKRHCAKSVSLLSMVFPVLHLAVGSRHQLIHDRIAGVQILESSNKCSHLIANKEEGAITTQKESEQEIHYANLWQRIPSAILDSITFGFITSIAMCFVIFALAHSLPAANSQFEAFAMQGATFLLSYLAGIVASVTVMALLESSKLQATPGKLILGLKVGNHSLARITLRQAIYKQLIQIFLYLSVFPLVGVFLIPAYVFSIIMHADAVVYITLTGWFVFYLIYGGAICITFFKKRQSLLDVLCKRYVFVESKHVSGSLTEIK